jgi:hypothetical protein
MSARVGKLENEQIRHDESLEQVRIDIEQRTDGGRLELGRFSITIEGRSIAEEEVESDPERPAFFERT